jgi:hypothetical protein
MIRKKDDRVYAGGSKYFNERTGKYEMPPGIKPPVKPGKPLEMMPIKPGKPGKPSRPGKPGNFTIMAKRMNDPNGFYYN